jgi:hypothetical protein
MFLRRKSLHLGIQKCSDKKKKATCCSCSLQAGDHSRRRECAGIGLWDFSEILESQSGRSHMSLLNRDKFILISCKDEVIITV